MNIYNGISQIPHIECGVISVGTFDGVHLAHRTILEEVCRLAKSVNGQSIVITFASHPRLLIDPDFDIKILMTSDEKNFLLEKIGIDNVIYLNFNWEVAQMSYVDFMEMLSSKIDIAKIVVGYDHNFGKNREGNILSLQKMSERHGFDVVEIPKQTIDGMDVKSSAIRKALNNGDISSVNRLLGYNYSIKCIVWKIVQDTISLRMNNTEKILPKDGMYPIEIEGKATFLEIKSEKLCLIDKNLSFGMKKEDIFAIKFIGNNMEQISPKS